MKVWVEVYKGVHTVPMVFSSEENIVNYWKETLTDKLDIVEREEDGHVFWVGLRRDDGSVIRYAYESEVDEYYVNKARREAEERRKEEEREVPEEPLGPCPKCGGEAVVNHPAYDGGACISCRKCGYAPQRLTWAPTDRRAIYNWNRLSKDSEDS